MSHSREWGILVGWGGVAHGRVGLVGWLGCERGWVMVG